MKKYEEFNTVYEDKALNKLDAGIEKLNVKIKVIEDGQKQDRTDMLIEFF